MDGSSSSPKARQVRCPQCGQPALFSPENPSRPFCSDRCRLLDLGQWADESYRIPDKSQAPSWEELDEAELENSD